MEGERWPKICLKEELRGIENSEPSRWGKEIKDTWKKSGSGEILRLMKEGEKPEILREKMISSMKILEDQEIQRNWGRIDKSNYWNGYKNIKRKWGRENYWEMGEFRGKIKEEWARLRCGNLSKEGGKVF